MISTAVPHIDYSLEYLEIGLTAGQPGAGSRWQAVFETARDGWDLERAQRILFLAKRLSLDIRQQSVVRYMEGTLLVRQGQWRAAAAVFERALAMKRQIGDRPGELAVLNAIAALYRRLDKPLDEVAVIYEQAINLAEEIADKEAQSALRVGLGVIFYAQGKLDRAQACQEAVLTQARDVQDSALEAVALHHLGAIAWTRGDLDLAQARLEMALGLEKECRNEHGQAETLNSLGVVKQAMGDWPAAAGAFQRSLDIMQRRNDLYGQVQVLANLGNITCQLGDYEQALIWHEQGLALARDLGDARLTAQMLAGLGDAYRTLQRWAEAESTLAAAIVQQRQSGDERSLKHSLLSLGGVYHGQGRIGEAEQAYQQALTFARQQRDSRLEAFALLDLGKVAALREDWPAARQLVEQAGLVAEANGYRDCLAAIHQVLGDLERIAPQPDASRILRHYTEALAYAADFNQPTLDQILDHLRAMWSAHAQDCFEEEVLWFAQSVASLWHEIGFAGEHPEVIIMLADLTASVGARSLLNPGSR